MRMLLTLLETMVVRTKCHGDGGDVDDEGGDDRNVDDDGKDDEDAGGEGNKCDDDARANDDNRADDHDGDEMLMTSWSCGW